MNGFAILKHASGNIYQGEVKRGGKEGFGICKYSLYFFTLKVHLFMQGIDETNKSIPYIQRETYWCVF